MDNSNKPLNKIKEKLPNTPKFREWVRLFFDRGNKETFLNATKSAIYAYNLDPVKQYASAGQIGYENLKKLENPAVKILESMGITFTELLKLGFKKVAEGSYSDWDKFMQRLGFFDKEEEKQQTVNVGVYNLIKEKYGEF
ncbi:MAG: hypothetical protein ACPLYC_01830 [Minisyncoccia bacterium]